jgi:GNAT superfamily N-acetyltransferase
MNNIDHIDIDSDKGEGNIAGYVVDSNQEQLCNWLKNYSEDSNRISSFIEKNCNRVAIAKNLNVDESSRGKGIGRDLLVNFLNEAENFGADAVVMISDKGESQNAGFSLKKFYENNDFFSVIDTNAGPFMVFPSEFGEKMKFELFGMKAPDKVDTLPNWINTTKISVNNQPIKTFHGTQSKFSEFEEGRPIWFSDKWEYADMFSSDWSETGERSNDSRVISAFLNIQNPVLTDEWGVTEGKAFDPVWRQEMISKGHDGVIFNLDDETEYIVFCASQIHVIDENTPNHSLSLVKKKLISP